MLCKIPLVVLIVRQSALRSALVARLALDGATVCTARDFDANHSIAARGPAVLVADAESIEDHPGGPQAVADDPRWERVIVLGEGETPDDADRASAAETAGDMIPRLHFLPMASAAASISMLLAYGQP